MEAKEPELGIAAGKGGNQFEITLLIGWFGGSDGHAHAAAGFHALHGTIDLDGVGAANQASRKAGTHPKSVVGFDEHAIAADVAGESAEDSGAPFDLELCAKGIAGRPATLGSA
jgi:hypothetical protein